MDLTKMTGQVAYQGALGANSHLACQQRLPGMDVLPCQDFDRAFEAVQSREASLAMIPIENSSAGRVADIHRLLPDSGLHIIAEHFLPIRHTLVARAGTKMADVTEAFSHEQALSQCRQYLRGHSIQPTAFSDTAAAAKWLAQEGARHQAAICPALAAEIYDLEVLEAGINDRPHNTTRFVILSKNAHLPSSDERTLTSLVFQTRSEPACLFKALAGFATAGINITKLESYMVGDRFDVAQFYVDVLTHQESAAFAAALRDLTHFCVEDGVRVMGTYPADPYRAL